MISTTLPMVMIYQVCDLNKKIRQVKACRIFWWNRGEFSSCFFQDMLRCFLFLSWKKLQSSPKTIPRMVSLRLGFDSPIFIAITSINKRHQNGAFCLLVEPRGVLLLLFPRHASLLFVFVLEKASVIA